MSFSTSVARWLSPKPAKSRHEKLLDPAKKHVTNFQLKPAVTQDATSIEWHRNVF